MRDFLICMLGVFFSGNVIAGEFDDYRYVLVRGKKHEVCRHMAQVYSQNFSKHPHDFGGISEVGGIKFPDPVKEPMLYLSLSKIAASFYPTSPEFEAVKWQLKEGDNERPFIVSRLDINNDGRNEVIAKLIFNSGEKGGWEYLEVLNTGDIDISNEVIPLSSFWKSKNYRENRIMGGAVVRPFIYKKVTYVHIYEYRRLSEETEQPNDRDEPYLSPEKVQILKYRGLLSGQNQQAELDLVCEYQMKVISQ